ncbi:hypothetical protein F5Y14DRAFT_369110 [Nemania sp. NC0429]|nr:hypothetical protein F5Y14DRAFT_369110 [Nemania sp. NC0429]
MSSRKVPLTFTFHRSGVHPPIFVAGTFSNPPWQPLEMDASVDQHGDCIFTRQVMVDECSEIQYKFRHASGDWWALDPDADTATDANGNVNSLLHSPAAQQHAAEETTAKVREVCAPEVLQDTTAAHHHATEAPSDAEVSVAAAGTGSANTNTGMDTLGSSPKGAAEKDELIHLSIAPIKEVVNIADEAPDSASQFDDDDYYDHYDYGDLEADGGDFPLFSHECFSSESDSPGSSLKEPGTQDDNHAAHSSENAVPSNTNYDDPRLEAFPSDRDAIIATMRRLSASIDVDPTMHDVIPLSAITTSESSSFAAGALSPKLSFLSVGDPKQSEEASQSQSQQPASILSPSRSLQSIAEAEEAPEGDATCARAHDTDTTAPAQRIGPLGTRKLSLASAGSSGEDEGIAMAIAPRKRMREAPRTTATTKAANGNAYNSRRRPIGEEEGESASSSSIVSSSAKHSSEQDDRQQQKQLGSRKPTTTTTTTTTGEPPHSPFPPHKKQQRQ